MRSQSISDTPTCRRGWRRRSRRIQRGRRKKGASGALRIDGTHEPASCGNYDASEASKAASENPTPRQQRVAMRPFRVMMCER